MTPIQLDLPMPPSVNGLFANLGRRRIKTREYTAWRTQAGWIVRAQRPASVTGPYRLKIALRRPNATSDLANREKAVSDLLQECNVISDDRHCERLTMWWATDLPQGVECRVTITPREG